MIGATNSESAETARRSAADSPLDLSADTVAWLTTGKKRGEIGEGAEPHRVAGFGGRAADVRHQEGVWQRNNSGVHIRFVVIGVNAGCAQLARPQRVDKRVVDDDSAACGIDED